MELLTCPACGCSIQAADTLLGRRVRCFACRHSFIATARQAAPPPARLDPLPPPRPPEPLPCYEEDALAGEDVPYCPRCDRRVAWRDSACPYCGEELEPDDGPRPPWRRTAHFFRRDYEPHRGALILTLGNLSMIVGGLSLCSFGLGALISVPIGFLALQMANRDLERIRDGYMDPRGKSWTKTGRTGAAVGIILGMIFATFYALVFLPR